MTWTRRAAVLALLLGVCGVVPCLAQNAATATQPVLTPQEIEDFLLNARVVEKKGGLRGVTNAQRVTLSDGRVTHDAQIQDVDISKALFEVGPKYSEIDALLARRAVIVTLFDDRIAMRGEAAVLYTQAR
jgi:hypothetical protein